MIKSHVIISSIGPPMKEGKDPIYEVAMNFPPSRVHLLSSDEPPPPHREPVEKNVENIRDYFSKTSVKVSFEYLPLDTFEENVYSLAATIIQYHREWPDCQIVLDLSAGRTVMTHALARAGQVVIDYMRHIEEAVMEIICAVRPRAQPMIAYTIGNPVFTNSKDAELLRHIKYPITQSALVKRVSWKNQSDISKAINRMKDKNLIKVEGHKSRKLTTEGERLLEFYHRIFYKQ